MLTFFVCVRSFLKSFVDGALVHKESDENVLASSMMSLIAALLSFGFQSSLPKFKDLVSAEGGGKGAKRF